MSRGTIDFAIQELNNERMIQQQAHFKSSLGSVKIILLAVFALPAMLIILATVFFISYVSFVRPFKVSGDAMSPAYYTNEYVLSKIIRDGETIQHSDVIIYQLPIDSRRDSIKRVIGLPGDHIKLEDGDVLLNGQKLIELYVPSGLKTYGEEFLKEGEEVIVPKDSYFVLGDNRIKSSDSRAYGFITRDKVVSKALFCYWNCR